MPSGTNKLRILVADDHELVRRGIRGLLRARRGWKVIGEAANGREAVEKANILKPDVAIVDISMPDLDGLQATRQIREASPTTKVVVLTMHESDQMVRRVLDAGALAYVLKSDLATHLVRAVKVVSAGQQFLTPRISDLVLKSFLKTRDQLVPTPFSKPRSVLPLRAFADRRFDLDENPLILSFLRTSLLPYFISSGLS